MKPALQPAGVQPTVALPHAGLPHARHETPEGAGRQRTGIGIERPTGTTVTLFWGGPSMRQPESLGQTSALHFASA